MENFGEKIRFGRRMRKIFGQNQFHIEPSTDIRGTGYTIINQTLFTHTNRLNLAHEILAMSHLLTRTVDECLDVSDVGVIDDDSYAFRRVFY